MLTIIAELVKMSRLILRLMFLLMAGQFAVVVMLIAVLNGVSLSVFAQDNICEKDDLTRHYSGKWAAELFDAAEDGSWRYADRYYTEISGVFRGLGIRGSEVLRGKEWTQYQDYLLVCNPADGRYRMMFSDFDGRELSVDLFVGVRDGNSLVFENVESSVDPVSIETGLFYRITFTPQDNGHFTIVGRYTLDKGNTWGPAAKVVYTRQK